MTRYSHFDILHTSTSDSKISLSASTLGELCFWEENIPLFSSRCLVSPHCHYSRVCYFDSSSTGCASYILELQNTISQKMWNVEDARKSSSYRELESIVLGLESFLHLVKGHTIKCYTDNQSALRVFPMCLYNNIKLNWKWIR